MFKKNLYGYRVNDRPPLQALHANSDMASSKSLHQTKSSTCRTKPRPSPLRDVGGSAKKGMPPTLPKNASQSRLAPQLKPPANVSVELRNKTSMRIMGVQPGSLDNSTFQETDSKVFPNRSKRPNELRFSVQSSANVFERLSARPHQSFEKHASMSKPPVDPLAILPSGLIESDPNLERNPPKFAQSLPGQFGLTQEFLAHEYQLETQRLKFQVESMQLELKNMQKLNSQMAMENDYLSKKTIEMAGESARQRSEIGHLQQTLAITADSQEEMGKIREELKTLRIQNINLTGILNEEKVEKDRVLRRITEKELIIQRQNGSIGLLEKERGVLIGLVERLKSELSGLRESNQEAISFLLNPKPQTPNPKPQTP